MAILAGMGIIVMIQGGSVMGWLRVPNLQFLCSGHRTTEARSCFEKWKTPLSIPSVWEEPPQDLQVLGGFSSKKELKVHPSKHPLIGGLRRRPNCLPETFQYKNKSLKCKLKRRSQNGK